MRKISIILALIFVLKANGQNSSVGFSYQSHLSKPIIRKGLAVNGEIHFTEDSARFINPRLGYLIQGLYIYKFNKYFRIQTGFSFSKYSTRIMYLSFTPPPDRKFYAALIHTLTYKFINLPIIANFTIPVNKILSISGSFIWSVCKLQESYWDSYDYSYFQNPSPDHEDWSRYEAKYNTNWGYNIGVMMKASPKFNISIHYQTNTFKNSQTWLFSKTLRSNGINIGLEYNLMKK